ncbi:hypothetical protein [Eubacterium sp. 1001713B170207_170306_E7]|uniref:hypothetical protein n=1 Tax=Eubacterium sp. 1001713B170207_170306_E7 TaxID=2787097 RepID=UPI00189BCE9B|nr:hypothetical protein [Eubacterium sp. 1001713B170207_170306_E7]
MDDKLLYRIVLSTNKRERKHFSEAMFWGDMAYRTAKEKRKLKMGIKYIFIVTPIFFILFPILVFTNSIQWLNLIMLGFVLYCLFLALLVPCGDYYLIEFKSKVGRKKGLIDEPFDYIDFYGGYIRYNGLDKTGYEGFNFKEIRHCFYLKFILYKNKKTKLEGFFLLKYQDIEKSGVDIDVFREFLSEKAIAFEE